MKKKARTKLEETCNPASIGKEILNEAHDASVFVRACACAWRF